MTNGLSVKFIMPTHSDSHFPLKRQIIEGMCIAEMWTPILPTYNIGHVSFSLEDMISEIRTSKLVVADLSLARPSCYYELGVAETLSAKIRLMAVNGAEIHQTTHANDVVFYDGIDGFRDTIKTILRNYPYA